MTAFCKKKGAHVLLHKRHCFLKTKRHSTNGTPLLSSAIKLHYKRIFVNQISLKGTILLSSERKSSAEQPISSADCCIEIRNTSLFVICCKYPLFHYSQAEPTTSFAAFKKLADNFIVTAIGNDQKLL